MCGVRYEGLPGRLWACYSCQLMSDTLLTDLSIHIHHNTLGQDILRCTNLGSLTEKRPRKVGYMLFVAGNSSVTPCVCIVYIVCSLCTFFSLVSAMFSFLSYMDRRWEGGVDGTLQSQQALDAGSFSRSTSVRLRCRAVWRPDTVQPLYVSVQCRIFTRYPRRCEQICMSDHVCTHHLPRLCGASHIDAFWIVRLLSLALQLWLLLTLPSPPACLPSLLHPNALFAWGVDTPGVARTFYYTDEASRLFTDTTQKIDTQRFQVAAVMGTSVPGLPVRDCAESCKSSVPRCAKMSTVDVMNKTIFEHLYLVQGLGTLYLRVKCPYVLTPPPLINQ